ncbi:type II restriction endonuclease [Rhodanobacter soli]|uniref:type II restriction endonuclease n=1 Tax=Rhodanobacter soli TaxID=590609 RepID=UPI0031CE1E7C
MANRPSWTDIRSWVAKSSRILIKKLARNDCGWADNAKNGHQNGVYVPREIREDGFFPEVRNTNPDKPHILDTLFETFWPSTGETKLSSLKHYTNKGTEMQFTRVPRDEFAGLTPASWLLGGTLDHPVGGAHHWFMVIDSESEEAELLESMFSLDSDFHFALFDPDALPGEPLDETEQLIEELTRALREGTLDQFIRRTSAMPATEDFALQAQESWLVENHKEAIDPWLIPNPGDVIMRISRDIEYTLFKRAEVRFRAAQVLRTISAGTDLASAVVRGFPELDATFLSAAQTRKSRAGRSFEHHVARVFMDGNVRYEEQVILGSRRPDFVLPDVMTLRSQTRPFDDAMIVSLKTTLRERWKQLSLERINGAVFLATVDDRVTADAISDMADNGIHLLVPESLKASKETCYAKLANVITFREFFDEEIADKRPQLRNSLI